VHAFITRPDLEKWPRRIGETSTRCGDASACLMLRTPLIPTRPIENTSNRMPAIFRKNGRESLKPHRRRPGGETGTDLF